MKKLMKMKAILLFALLLPYHGWVMAAPPGPCQGPNKNDPGCPGAEEPPPAAAEAAVVEPPETLAQKFSESLKLEPKQYLFRQGEAAFFVNGPWALGDYKKDLGDDLGVVAIPAGTAPAAPLNGIDGFYINPNSANKEAALEVALYLTGTAASQSMMDDAGHVPANTTVDVTDPLMLGLLEAFGTAYIRPQVPELGLAGAAQRHPCLDFFPYLEYLAAFNRRVINDIRTLNYEMSKVEQYRLLKRHGLAYPSTVFSSEISELIKAAKQIAFPVLVKHNRSCKEYGMKRCDSLAELTQYLYSPDLIPSPDEIFLVQEYIESKENWITRVQIIDGQLVYAYRESIQGKAAFIPDFNHPIVEKYIEITKNTGYDIVNFEFIESQTGSLYTFDINGTLFFKKEIENQSNYPAKKAFQTFIRKLMGYS